MRFLAQGSIIILSAALNFMIFIVSYNYLVFPYLHEEQRVENAPYIFIYILPAFILVSIVIVILTSLIRRNRA